MFDFGILPFQLAKDWIGRLYGDLVKISSARKAELDQIANIFGDPVDLVKHYIEPDCQQPESVTNHPSDRFQVAV